MHCLDDNTIPLYKRLSILEKNMNSYANVNVNLEKFGKDLLMLSVNLSSEDRKSIPSYWRITNLNGLQSSENEIPPLEIGIDTNSGKISNITLFINNFTKICEEQSDYMEKNGDIILNTNIFMEENDYIDSYDGYKIFLLNRGILCKFDFCKDYLESYIIKNLVIHINEKREVCGFAITKLTIEEIKMIESIKPNSDLEEITL